MNEEDTNQAGHGQSYPGLTSPKQRKEPLVRGECLDKFIILGKRHLDHVLGQFVDYYNHRRSHMQRDNLPPLSEPPDKVEALKLDQIEVKEYVGGLVKSFERTAA